MSLNRRKEPSPPKPSHSPLFMRKNKSASDLKAAAVKLSAKFITTEVDLYKKPLDEGEKPTALSKAHHRMHSSGHERHVQFITGTICEEDVQLIKNRLPDVTTESNLHEEHDNQSAVVFDSVVTQLEKLFHRRASEMSPKRDVRALEEPFMNLADSILLNPKTKLKQLLFTHFKPFSDIHLGEQSRQQSTDVLFDADTPKEKPSTADKPSSSRPLIVRSDSKGHVRSASADNIPITTQSRKNSSLRPRLVDEKQQQIMNMLSPTKLFDFVVVVSLVEEVIDDKRVLTPKITYQFPPSEKVMSSFESLDSASTRQTAKSDGISLSENTLLENIPLFCFPEFTSADGAVTVDEYVKDDLRFRTDAPKGETFSFVLTDIERSKRFGYCRRLLTAHEVEGDIYVEHPTSLNVKGKGVSKGSVPVKKASIKKRKRIPQVYCIISPAGCFSLFSQILDIVVQKKTEGSSNSNVYSFLKAVIAQPFPKPGKTLIVRAFPGRRASQNMSDEMEEFKLERPVDLTFEHVSFNRLLNAVGLVSPSAFQQAQPFNTLISLFSALLMERRIVLVSKSLQTLSDCCNAAVALIYPMEWQHAFIPILPRKLLEFVCSPTPYVIGVLPSEVVKLVHGWSFSETLGLVPAERQRRSSSAAKNGKATSPLAADGILPLEDAFVLNLDTGTVMRYDTEKEDKNAIPLFIVQLVKQKLERALRDFVNSSQSLSAEAYEMQRNSAISNVFLKLFTCLMGGYRQFMEIDIQQATIASDLSVPPNSGRRISVDDPSNLQLDASSNLRHSRSEEAFGAHSETIVVRFDTDQFLAHHPLLKKNSTWLTYMLSKDTELSQKDRQEVQAFLRSLCVSQNFQYFIQEREEAFQYHYQKILDQSKNIQDTLRMIDSRKNVPAGVKYYYALAQSKFEQKISRIEIGKFDDV